MKKNLGSTDKIVRYIIAIVLIVLYFSGIVTGVLGFVALGLAAIAIVTSLINFCPLYAIFNINSCKIEK